MVDGHAERMPPTLRARTVVAAACAVLLTACSSSAGARPDPGAPLGVAVDGVLLEQPTCSRFVDNDWRTSIHVGADGFAAILDNVGSGYALEDAAHDGTSAALDPAAEAVVATVDGDRVAFEVDLVDPAGQAVRVVVDGTCAPYQP